MFKGSIPALVTPMRNGSIDEEAFRAFVDWQIREGSSGVVPVGTTGESPTLSHAEHRRVVEICIEAAGKRVPVIAGAGSNNTREAIELADARRRGRRRRRAGGHSLLQQAQPARPLRAFPRRGGGDQHPAHHLQHPAALGRRHERGDDGRALPRLPQHRRREGRDRQPRAREPAAPRHGAGLHPAFRRGSDGARLQGAWRARLHLRHRQRGAKALLGVPGGLQRGRLRHRTHLPGPADAAAPRTVPGAEPGADQVRAVAARPYERGRALADRDGRRRRRGRRSNPPCGMPAC